MHCDLAAARSLSTSTETFDAGSPYEAATDPLPGRFGRVSVAAAMAGTTGFSRPGAGSLPV